MINFNINNVHPSNQLTSSNTNRFSLLILEPGEIYFEDYLVYYHQPRKGSYESSSLPPAIKGNLKVCSKSLVFDPLDFSRPLIKFAYKNLERIELAEQDVKRFALSTRQTVQCKANNKIGAYTVLRAVAGKDKSPAESSGVEKHEFELIFTSTDDSLDLMQQLHRASTLNDYEKEDIMLDLILHSRLRRDQHCFDLLPQQLEDVAREHVQFEALVNKIGPLVKNPGKLFLTNMAIYYKSFNNLHEEDTKVRLVRVKHVIKRRYHLRNIACEIIFDHQQKQQSTATNTTTTTISKSLPYLYLTFESEAERDTFYTRLCVEQRDKLTTLEYLSPENMLQRWRYGLISNFDYLLHLNTLADRSYNDLTQYPVFPWVLADYTSSELDLTEESVYRDLSKPVGALNPERLARLLKRSADMQSQQLTTIGKQQSEQQQQPQFIYGTHYSTPAFISYYLVRREPEWQLCLQNGRFDQANRLFHSVEDTWNNCLQADSDVKELIPEFYDTACDSPGSFLRNELELDLGVRQQEASGREGVRVNHVHLPPWAKASPAQFVAKMREALESDYVSTNLCHWIDLIFGYKQRGDEAKCAHNLFYYLCYEGNVDLASIKNYAERKSLEIQIQEFGQIPTQLFNTPHLSRAKLSDMMTISGETAIQQQPTTRRTFSNASSNSSNSNDNNGALTTHRFTYLSASSMDQLNEQQQIHQVINLTEFQVRLSLKLHHKGQINDVIFLLPNANENETSLDAHQQPLLCSVSSDNCLKIYSLEDRSLFRSYKVANFSVSSVVVIQPQQLFLLSCWDNSLYLYDLNFNRCMHTLADIHEDAISRSFVLKQVSKKKPNTRFLLTSSWDSLVKLWTLDLATFKAKCLHEISLCDSACVDMWVGERHVAVVCKDGSVHVWSLLFNNNNNKEDKEDDKNENSYGDDDDDDDEQDLQKTNGNYLYPLFSMNHQSEESANGNVTACAMIEEDSDELLTTLCVCTSSGYVKIINTANRQELFSLRLTCDGGSQQHNCFLTRLHYTSNYIVCTDNIGYVYFIDLKQSSTDSSSPSSSSFLAHKVKVDCGGCALTAISVYDNCRIVCVGDAEGNLHLLSTSAEII